MNHITIAFEGVDYAGKTTTIEKVKAKLETMGHSVGVYSSMSGDGNIIRAINDHKDNPTASYLLHAALRASNHRFLMDLQGANGIVLMDRSFWSNVAYSRFTHASYPEFCDVMYNVDYRDRYAMDEVMLLQVWRGEYEERSKDDRGVEPYEVMERIQNEYVKVLEFYNMPYRTSSSHASDMIANWIHKKYVVERDE